MTRHIILLSSCYSTGERIALDYCNADAQYVFNELKKIQKETNNLTPIAMHMLTTKSNSWGEVILFDSFFKNVRVVKNRKTFIKLILKDKELSSLDIAEYILSKCKCTHLKLEKLTYLCYADYLCNFGEKLFNDKIYAFKYGPVVKQVYNKYKGKYKEEIETEMPELIKYNMPIKSRILSSANGFIKLQSIENTINSYKGYTAYELVDITHNENSPWTKCIKPGESYKEITDKDIIKYHCNEHP